MPRPSASQTLCSGSKATDGSLIRGHGPPSLIVVPGSPPVVQLRPPFCDVEKTRLLAPPPPNQRPDCVSVTIVCPAAYESGSSCVLCWCPLPGSVYGSSLIGVGRTLPAETVATKNRPSAAIATAVQTDFALRPLSPTAPILISPGSVFYLVTGGRSRSGTKLCFAYRIGSLRARISDAEDGIVTSNLAL